MPATDDEMIKDFGRTLSTRDRGPPAADLATAVPTAVLALEGR